MYEFLCLFFGLGLAPGGFTKLLKVLGMTVKSKTMTLSFPQEQVQKIKSQCLKVYRARDITLLELTRLLGTLASTIQAILRARLQFWYSIFNNNKQQHERGAHLTWPQ